jgi:hypothetical protein
VQPVTDISAAATVPKSINFMVHPIPFMEMGFIPREGILSRAARKGAYGPGIWQDLRLAGSFPCQQMTFSPAKRRVRFRTETRASMTGFSTDGSARLFPDGTVPPRI